jgi:2-polyprenyl-6-hydroxyphenyl methylase/3-demethylubiquinone-9 3-methyltransferase
MSRASSKPAADVPAPGEHKADHSLKCVACGASMDNHVKVRLVGGQLRACAVCKTWVYYPRPDQTEQSSIHDTPDYFEHPYFKLRRTLNPAQLRRCTQIFQRIAGAIDLSGLRGRRMLDIGCDTGAFLLAAAQVTGVVPIGIDVNHKAVSTAIGSGIEAYCGTLETAPAHLHDFPLITAIDLIEHVSDPGALLVAIRSRLCPGGLTYIETPNIRSTVYRIGRWLSILTAGHPAGLYKRLFPEQHIQYFTRESLSTLVRSCGLEVVQLGERHLPFEDIAASNPVRAAMATMQAIDRLSGERILIWSVLRRPQSLG